MTFKEKIRECIEEAYPGKYEIKVAMNHLVISLPDHGFSKAVATAKRDIQKCLDEKCPSREDKILIDFKGESYEDSMMVMKE